MTRASDLAKLLGAGATILDGTTITTADNDPQLILTSTDADANRGPELHFVRDSASPADNDLCGTIKAFGKNSAGEDVQLSEIIFRNEDVTDGTEDGQIILNMMRNGASAQVMKLSSTETVLNGDSLDLDFRIESDNNANAFFVQGSDGNVGIGTSSPSNLLSIDASGTVTTRYTSTGSAFSLFQVDNTGSMIFSADHGNNVSGTSFIFKTDGASERARINADGHFYVNTGGAEPSASQVGVRVSGTQGQNFWKSANSGTGGYDHLAFFNGNGNVGSIYTSGSSTSYGTSSDYRLKENVTYDFDATTRLKQLKPSRFNFIADADTTVDGFLAHEVQSVVPEAISGEKDAVNEDGSIKPQNIDQSKIVPLLVKTIQELEARITALESA